MSCLVAVFLLLPPESSEALSGGGTRTNPYLVGNGADLDEALVIIADDYKPVDPNAENQNVSDMHYISLTADVDAITSATYGNEDEDHPVRVTIEGNGHIISGDIPDEPPAHAAGNKYTGLRFANRTPFTEAGRGNHIVLKNLTVRGLYNAETHGGGALAIFGGKLEVENCVFDGNASYGTSRGGGAILLQHRASLLSIKNSTFVNNTSRGSGGAVDSSGDQDNAETAGENVVIENSTFYGNKSTEAVIETTGRDGSITRSPQGGGAITYSRALGRITNSTIVGNEAASGKGGGVYARWDISGNASGLGTKSEVKLENSIVAGNGSGADVDLSNNNPASADVTGSYNVIGTSGAPSGAFSNTQLGADVSDFLAPGAPKVHAEGATPTIALLGAPGSPALNKVPLENAPALDQRGRPRVGLADIGAFELQVPGNGTASSPFSVKNGLELDEALIVIADDYRENSEGQNISDMHYVSLTADVDAITSATYGDEDGDHPVRVTIDGNGYAIRGVLPASAPTHARGKRYTGLRFANRTPFTADGRGNHIILKNLTARGLYNAETHGGGALAIFGGKLEVENSVFDGNAAYGTTRGGGAILLQLRASLLSIKNSTFVNNTSIAPGGAVDSSGDQDNAEVEGENAVIENSTFYGNKSTREEEDAGGGGAISYGRALGRITNSTIVGNEAANGKGGGVYARWNISGNPSGLGTKSKIELVNSIVAGNGSGTDVDVSNNNPASADVTGDYNLTGSLGGVTFGSNSLNAVDVRAFLASGSPKVNDRGTPTIALLDAADSPAIDSADPDEAPATDQRGLPRGSFPDIGAYELQTESTGEIPEQPADEDTVDTIIDPDPDNDGTHWIITINVPSGTIPLNTKFYFWLVPADSGGRGASALYGPFVTYSKTDASGAATLDIDIKNLINADGTPGYVPAGTYVVKYVDENERYAGTSDELAVAETKQASSGSSGCDAGASTAAAFLTASAAIALGSRRDKR